MFTHSHYSYIFYSTVCCLSPRYACCSAAWHQPRPTFSCAARSAGNFCASTHVHPRTPQSATAVLRATATKDEAASLVGPYCNCGWQLSVLPNRTFSSDRVIFANFVSYISAQDRPKFRAHFAQPASAQISENIARNSDSGQLPGRTLRRAGGRAHRRTYWYYAMDTPYMYVCPRLSLVSQRQHTTLL